MDKDKKGHIRYLNKNEKLSISEIARKTGVCRKTVRNALKDESLLSVKRNRPSKLEAFKDEIKNILADNTGLSGKLILEKITEKGYDGGKTIFYDYLSQIRKQKRKAFNHLENLPGDQAQVDWGYFGQISCGQYKRKLYLFCMALSYSRYFYMEFTVSMDQNTFLACHINGFKFFGGVAKTILYDNLKSVVCGRYGKEIAFNARFLDFYSWYGFKPVVCNIRAPHEKGIVENVIKYARNNFFPRKKYSDFNHIRAEGGCWLRNVANRRLHSTTRKIPCQAFEREERQYLLKLPPKDYDYPEAQPLNARQDCLFQFDTNKYSIPAGLINETLAFKPYQNEIHIFLMNELVARHKRCYDKYQVIKDPAHYASLLRKKKKAANSYYLQIFENLCPEAKDYSKGLLQKQSNIHFQVRKILDLAAIFGKTQVCAAIVHALAFKAFHWEHIKNIVMNSPKQKNERIQITNHKEIMDINVSDVDLSRYDDLLNRKEDDNDE